MVPIAKGDKEAAHTFTLAIAILYVHFLGAVDHGTYKHAYHERENLYER